MRRHEIGAVAGRLGKTRTVLITNHFDAWSRRAAAGLAGLLVAGAAIQDAMAEADCNPPAAHHAASARRRSHHHRAKAHPLPVKKAKPVLPKRAAGHECARPLAVTLADIGALGSLEDAGPMAIAAVLAPGPEPDGPAAGGVRGGPQFGPFALPLGGDGRGGPELGGGIGTPGGGGLPGGGPGGPGGGPGEGGPSAGGPGGGSYAPPPGGGGGPPGSGAPGVPEPGTWVLMLVGVGAVGALARGRRPAGHMVG